VQVGRETTPQASADPGERVIDVGPQGADGGQAERRASSDGRPGRGAAQVRAAAPTHRAGLIVKHHAGRAPGSIL
jgi:hypothetical protein